MHNDFFYLGTTYAGSQQTYPINETAIRLGQILPIHRKKAVGRWLFRAGDCVLDSWDSTRRLPGRNVREAYVTAGCLNGMAAGISATSPPAPSHARVLGLLSSPLLLPLLCQKHTQSLRFVSFVLYLLSPTQPPQKLSHDPLPSS